jgi:hypothetical protein
MFLSLIKKVKNWLKNGQEINNTPLAPLKRGTASLIIF